MVLLNAKPVPLLILDLDGTVRQGKDDALGRFVNGPEDVVVFPEAVTMMERWRSAGGRIIGVTNQGGISLGYVTREKVIKAILETQSQTGNLFDIIQHCPHHPDASDSVFNRCWCRKPKPGMAIEAAMQLTLSTGEVFPPNMALFVGDRPEDEECARLLDVDFEWAHEWRARVGSEQGD